MARPKKTATATPKAAPAKPAETKAAPSTENELADAIAAALRPVVDYINANLMIAARLAAVDTIRTAERPTTLFRRAIAEGIEAAKLIVDRKNMEA